MGGLQDTAKFPGRRGLYPQSERRDGGGTADGVAPKDLYPLDIDRAFAKLDKLRSDVAVWWTSGAQNTQLLQSGEVDMADTWSARAFAGAIDAPVRPSTSSGRGSTRSTAGQSRSARRRSSSKQRELRQNLMQPERPGRLQPEHHREQYEQSEGLQVRRPGTAPKMLPMTTGENRRPTPFATTPIKDKNYASVADRFQEWLLTGGKR